MYGGGPLGGAPYGADAGGEHTPPEVPFGASLLGMSSASATPVVPVYWVLTTALPEVAVSKHVAPLQPAFQTSPVHLEQPVFDRQAPQPGKTFQVSALLQSPQVAGDAAYQVVMLAAESAISTSAEADVAGTSAATATADRHTYLRAQAAGTSAASLWLGEWIEADVQGRATATAAPDLSIRRRIKVRYRFNAPPGDRFYLRFAREEDGSGYTSVSGRADTQWAEMEVFSVLRAGRFTLQVEYARPANSPTTGYEFAVYIDALTITDSQGVRIEGFESETPVLSRTGTWTRTTEVAYEGSYSLKSPPTAPDQTSTTTFTFELRDEYHGVLPPGCTFWAKADTLALPDGSPVTSLPMGQHFQPPLAASGGAPTFVASAPALGGQPALRFAASEALVGRTPQRSPVYTAFVVYVAEDVSTARMALHVGTSRDIGHGIASRRDDTHSIGVLHGGYGSPWRGTELTPEAGRAEIIAAEHAGNTGNGTLRIWRAGGAGTPQWVGSTSGVQVPFSDSATGVWLGADGGADRRFQGLIAEALVFDRALPDAERDQVLRYLAEKYKIATTFSDGSEFPYGLLRASARGVATATATVLPTPPPPTGIIGGHHCPSRQVQLAWKNPCAGGDDLSLPFDYAVIRYFWDISGGRDLDTRTAVVGFGLDNQDVGWARNRSVGGGVLQWASDNTNVGYEAVLVDFPKLRELDPTAAEARIRMRAFWYAVANDRNFHIQFTTYRGGTMAPSGYNYVNHGGEQVQDIWVQRYAPTQISTNVDGDPMGFLVFDYTTGTAWIEDDEISAPPPPENCGLYLYDVAYRIPGETEMRVLASGVPGFSYTVPDGTFPPGVYDFFVRRSDWQLSLWSQVSVTVGVCATATWDCVQRRLIVTWGNPCAEGAHG